MPTTPQKAKRLLREGKAKVMMSKPFTIQLTCATGENKQPIDLGGDTGYSDSGFSAVTEKAELISGNYHLLEGQVKRNEERRMYRKQRRRRLRYRAPRLDNRKRPDGWLAPSIQHKKDAHIRLNTLLHKILPITSTTIEVAAFDIQKINNPGIEGKEYQQGDQFGFWNIREYVIHRDDHKCQNPNCKNHSKEKILQVHHIGYWKGDRTDRPGNLTTLCDKCHTPANHKEGGFLYGWQPKPGHAPAAFMNIVRWQIVNELDCDHTYGYITKSKRIALGIEKTHANDAFVIAGGSTQERCIPINFVQNRHNNRSLEKFYDAKYIDLRTGKKASGQDLFSGRRTRNKNLSGLSKHIYRQEKLSPGRRNIRRQRYSLQPGDTVLYEGRKCLVQGSAHYGEYIKLAGIAKQVKTANVNLLYYGRGLHVCTA
jgi:hypothetical protein